MFTFWWSLFLNPIKTLKTELNTIYCRTMRTKFVPILCSLFLTYLSNFFATPLDADIFLPKIVGSKCIYWESVPTDSSYLFLSFSFSIIQYIIGDYNTLYGDWLVPHKYHNTNYLKEWCPLYNDVWTTLAIITCVEPVKNTGKFWNCSIRLSNLSYIYSVIKWKTILCRHRMSIPLWTLHHGNKLALWQK